MSENQKPVKVKDGQYLSEVYTNTTKDGVEYPSVKMYRLTKDENNEWQKNPLTVVRHWKDADGNFHESVDLGEKELEKLHEFTGQTIDAVKTVQHEIAERLQATQQVPLVPKQSL